MFLLFIIFIIFVVIIVLKIMNKLTKIILIAVIVIGLVAWGIYSQMPKQNAELKRAEQTKVMGEKQKKSLNVNAIVVGRCELSDNINVTGLLLPDEQVDLAFETSGMVVEIYFSEGSKVAKGQLLAKVNDNKLQAELHRLVIQLKLAEDRLSRQEALLKNDAISQEDYEQVKTEFETLQAEIDIVQSEIELTELRAPFDGVIGLRQISVGTFASTQTVVSRLTRIVPLKVEFSVPERYSNDINIGTNLNFRVDGHTNDFAAKVYAKESSIDVATHTLKVRALFDNKRSELVPGCYASVSLQKQHITNAIAIPSEAIIPELGKDKVFVYKSGKAMPIDVVLGLRTESKVEVVSGLNEGDTLIVSGTLQLRTAMPVVIDNLN